MWGEIHSWCLPSSSIDCILGAILDRSRSSNLGNVLLIPYVHVKYRLQQFRGGCARRIFLYLAWTGRAVQELSKSCVGVTNGYVVRQIYTRVLIAARLVWMGCYCCSEFPIQCTHVPSSLVCYLLISRWAESREEAGSLIVRWEFKIGSSKGAEEIN